MINQKQIEQCGWTLLPPHPTVDIPDNVYVRNWDDKFFMQYNGAYDDFHMIIFKVWPGNGRDVLFKGYVETLEEYEFIFRRLHEKNKK